MGHLGLKIAKVKNESFTIMILCIYEYIYIYTKEHNIYIIYINIKLYSKHILKQIFSNIIYIYMYSKYIYTQTQKRINTFIQEGMKMH